MIVRYAIRELMRELSNKAREFFELIMPPIDIYEDDNELVILIDLPGFKKEDINVRITNNVLSIKAKREGIERPGYKYMLQRPLRIDKSIPLPIKVKSEGELKATYKDGVLEIRIPLSGVSTIKIE